jgi:RND family efflux transporter MFP subunit
MNLLLKTVAALGLLILVFAGGYLLGARMPQAKPAATERRVLYYVDPMHPAYTSDKPGIAPDCGMKLEPVYADEPAAGAAKTVLYYRDPKKPDYTSEKPGLNPETGNTLEPVYAEGAATPAVPPGAIQVSPERQQLIGVKFATAEIGSAGRSIRAVGRVSFDETRVAHVHTRIDGWIEQVFVDFTGALVTKGEPMLTIYSPEMLASQQELLLAARARDLMSNNPLASAAQHGQSLFEAAKRRLELWDLSADQIQQVLTTGEPIRSITLHSPSAGFVTTRNAFPNQKITPDSDLYTIADLSHVWIVADVFESDITSIKIGDPAHVVFPYPGTPSIAANVSYIQPEVDPTTRTLKVRLDAANPGLRMKPDMFVNVELGASDTLQLTVPTEALLDTGDRQTVFVDLGNGYLEPRQVVVGDRFGDRVVITSGLSAGERVVSSGTFLIDSESQLKAAASGMGAPQRQQGDAPAAKPMDPSMPMPGAPRHD